MPDLGALGDLVIQVGGDITPLDQELQKIPDLGAQAAAGLNSALGTSGIDALDAAVKGATDQMDLFAESSKQAGDAVQQLSLFDTHSIDALDTAFGSLNDNLPNMATGLHDVSDAEHNVADAAHGAAQAAQEQADGFGKLLEAAKEITGIAITFESIKKAIENSAEAFGEFQKASIALRTITGDAQGAAAMMAQLPELANRFGQSITDVENAAQRLAAIGVGLHDIPGVLEGIADAAARMNTPFSTVQARFDQIVLSGQLMARSLVSLGLSLNDVARALEDTGKFVGLVGQNAQTVSDAFRQFGDEADRATLLAQVSMQKTGKIAEETAQGVTGAFNRMANEVHETWKRIGADLDNSGFFQGIGTLFVGALKVVEDWGHEIILVFKDVANGLTFLLSYVNDFATGAAKMLKDLATGSFKELASDFKETGMRMLADWQNFTSSLQQDWDTTAKNIDAIWEGPKKAATEGADANKQAADSFTQVGSAASTAASGGIAQFSQSFDKVVAQLRDSNPALNSWNIAVQMARDGVVEFNTHSVELYSTMVKQKVAIADAKQALEDTIEAEKRGLASKGQVKEKQEELNKATQAFTGEATKAKDADLAVTTILKEMEGDIRNAGKALTDLAKAQQDDEASITAVQGAYEKLENTIQGARDALNYITDAHKRAEAAAQLQKVADEALAGAHTLFVGPVQKADDAIQVINGHMRNAAEAANEAALGIETLTTSEDPGLTGATDAATVKIVGLGDSIKTLADLLPVVANAASSVADAVTQVGDAAADAGTKVESLADQMKKASDAFDKMFESGQGPSFKINVNPLDLPVFNYGGATQTFNPFTPQELAIAQAQALEQLRAAQETFRKLAYPTTTTTREEVTKVTVQDSPELNNWLGTIHNDLREILSALGSGVSGGVAGPLQLLGNSATNAANAVNALTNSTSLVLPPLQLLNSTTSGILAPQTEYGKALGLAATIVGQVNSANQSLEDIVKQLNDGTLPLFSDAIRTAGDSLANTTSQLDALGNASFGVGQEIDNVGGSLVHLARIADTVTTALDALGNGSILIGQALTQTPVTPPGPVTPGSIFIPHTLPGAPAGPINPTLTFGTPAGLPNWNNQAANASMSGASQTQITINVNGSNIVGSNGMNEFANIIGNIFTDRMMQAGGRLTRG